MQVQKAMGGIKVDEIKEKYRKTTYWGMKSGSCVVFFFDKIVPNLKSEYFDPKTTPSNIFIPSEFEKKDTYMQIVHEDENVDNFGNKGYFEMDSNFRICCLAYVDPDDEEYKQMLTD